MKTITGKKAIEIIEQYDINTGENFEEMKETLEGNSQSFDVEALVTDDEQTFYDYRIFDPYQHYCKEVRDENGDPERLAKFVNPDGWTHWQFESDAAREFEE
jgi:hypothetical protein